MLYFDYPEHCIDVPIFNTAQLHAEAVVNLALAER